MISREDHNCTSNEGTEDRHNRDEGFQRMDSASIIVMGKTFLASAMSSSLLPLPCPAYLTYLTGEALHAES